MNCNQALNLLFRQHVLMPYNEPFQQRIYWDIERSTKTPDKRRGLLFADCKISVSHLPRCRAIHGDHSNKKVSRVPQELNMISSVSRLSPGGRWILKYWHLNEIIFRISTSTP